MVTGLFKKALSLTRVYAMALVASPSLASAVEELPEHQQRPIRNAAPEQPRVAPKKARTVLIFNTPDHLYANDPHKGYCVPYGSYAMQALGKKSGAFRPVVSSDLAMFLPENIKRFDAIVLNNTAGPWITPSDADIKRAEFHKHGADKDAVEQVLRQSLLDYVSAGGGLVAYHFATGANQHWPEYHRLLGAKFTGHPWNEEVGIKVDEPSHPLVAAFGGKDFPLADEIYEFGDPYDRRRLRVLLSLDTAKTNMNVKWIQRSDGDFAQAWVKSYGQGRVFYAGFGHRDGSPDRDWPGRFRGRRSTDRERGGKNIIEPRCQHRLVADGVGPWGARSVLGPRPSCRTIRAFVGYSAAWRFRTAR
ncbi:MAG: hypothetical protein A2V70_08925 [Planctomycetes bacterium RBG_13_63_9]|nr:MAG: hypothetical protein A2V70_08925 [Planctomycetes bacterium RBG_13_63_9]